MRVLRNSGGVLKEAASSVTARQELITADWLAGVKVVDAAGESIGQIVHIMLDVSSGTVAYAVLSFERLLGLGDKLFAVPWHALDYDIHDKLFVMHVDKERLKNAPGFDKHHWPSMADPGWAKEVHAYYGAWSAKPD